MPKATGTTKSVWDSLTRRAEPFSTSPDRTTVLSSSSGLTTRDLEILSISDLYLAIRLGSSAERADRTDKARIKARRQRRMLMAYIYNI